MRRVALVGVLGLLIIGCALTTPPLGPITLPAPRPKGEMRVETLAPAPYRVLGVRLSADVADLPEEIRRLVGKKGLAEDSYERPSLFVRVPKSEKRAKLLVRGRAGGWNPVPLHRVGPELRQAIFPTNYPEGTTVLDLRLVGPAGEGRYRLRDLPPPPAPAKDPGRLNERAVRIEGRFHRGWIVLRYLSPRPDARTVYDIRATVNPRATHSATSGWRSDVGSETVEMASDLYEAPTARVEGEVRRWTVRSVGRLIDGRFRLRGGRFFGLLNPSEAVDFAVEPGAWQEVHDPKSGEARLNVPARLEGCPGEWRPARFWRVRKPAGTTPYRTIVPMRAGLPAGWEPVRNVAPPDAACDMTSTHTFDRKSR